MGKTFEYIIPRSESDSEFADFEYLLRWIGRDGAEYWHMFFDPKFKLRVMSNVVNQDDSSRIEQKINDIEREIELEAYDFSENDLLIVQQIIENKVIYRYKKDGTIERFAPDGNSFSYKKMDRRYKVSFTLIQSNVFAWK